MRKYLFLFILLCSIALQAQYSIKGTIDPDHDYSWILLYKMENGDQNYIANADVVDGKFTFEIDDKDGFLIMKNTGKEWDASRRGTMHWS